MSNLLGGIGVGLGAPVEHRFTCSRAGCQDEAEWALVWRNPKIHSEDRRKTWLACEPHLDVLKVFLTDRNFPLEVRTVKELDG